MSINLKHLKIGSLVFNCDNVITEVVRVESKEYGLWNSGDDDNNVVLAYLTPSKDYHTGFNINPIPISSGVLHALGFIKSPESNHYVNESEGVIIYWRSDHEGYLGISDSRKAVEFDLIQYTHQLQNLLSSMYGLEVQYKIN